MKNYLIFVKGTYCIGFKKGFEIIREGVPMGQQCVMSQLLNRSRKLDFRNSLLWV